jgi:hypothetical protein
MEAPKQAQFIPALTPRRADRVDRAFAATVCRDGHPDAAVQVENLSPHGFKMSAVAGLGPHAFFYLQVRPDIRLPAQARWLEDGHAGCEFPRHLTARQYLQVLHATGAEQGEAARAGVFGRLRALLAR